MNRMRQTLAVFVATTIALVLSAPDVVAQQKVRIAQQFGLSYLPLHVALELKLITKHAKARGIADPEVEVVRLASGAAVNDAIISGTVDVAMAGLTVLLNVRDKTFEDEKMLYFTATPSGVMAYADYMARAGQLKHKLASWKDAFFENVHGLPGN
jgi:ABC-type nitrate/sulfonate/bicarbonate transport system substrate-binding protein